MFFLLDGILASLIIKDCTHRSIGEKTELILATSVMAINVLWGGWFMSSYPEIGV